MEMVFLNVERALNFLAKENSPLRVALGMLLQEHAQKDAEVKIFGEGGVITRMTFSSDKNLSDVIEVGEDVISVHSGAEDAAWANVFPRGSKEAQDASGDSTDKPAAETTSKDEAVDAVEVKSEKTAAADETLALKVGKVVLTVAAVGAAVGAGVWAWKKWGKSST
jgi:hypothetical protein